MTLFQLGSVYEPVTPASLLILYPDIKKTLHNTCVDKQEPEKLKETKGRVEENQEIKGKLDNYIFNTS